MRNPVLLFLLGTAIFVWHAIVIRQAIEAQTQVLKEIRGLFEQFINRRYPPVDYGGEDD